MKCSSSLLLISLVLPSVPSFAWNYLDASRAVAAAPTVEAAPVVNSEAAATPPSVNPPTPAQQASPGAALRFVGVCENCPVNITVNSGPAKLTGPVKITEGRLER